MLRSWLFTALAVLAGCLGGTARCAAERPCPWLNAATAGGVLGGDPVMTVSAATPQGDATCEFAVTHGATVYRLSVAVHSMVDPAKEFAGYLARCEGTRTALRGIGNEAVQCVAKGGSKGGEEQVVGRVRERAFVLTVQAGTVRPGSVALSDEAENLAEQIAGAMF